MSEEWRKHPHEMVHFVCDGENWIPIGGTNMIELKPWEAKIVADLLDMAGDRFSNDSCEDYEIDNNREAHAMLRAMDLESGWPEEELTEFVTETKTLGTGTSRMCSAMRDRIRSQLFEFQR